MFSLLLSVPLRAQAIPFLPFGLFVGLEGRLGDLVGRRLLYVWNTLAQADERRQPELLLAR